MSALKLSSDPNEKKQLKVQCGDIMTTAGRIKNDTNWKPTVETRYAIPQRVDIDQWAAGIVSVESTTSGTEETASWSSLSRHGLTSTTGPVSSASGPSGKDSIFQFSVGGRSECTGVPGRGEKGSYQPPALLIDLSDNPISSLLDLRSSAPTDARHEARPEVTPRSDTGTHVAPGAVVGSSSLPTSEPRLRTLTHEGVASLSPATASYSHIRRLSEPVSTRTRSKREDIILLKASIVNGFKCPPWDRNPPPGEFAAQQDDELFTWVVLLVERFVSDMT
jgi:calpain-7